MVLSNELAENLVIECYFYSLKPVAGGIGVLPVFNFKVF